jgi:hypothetical protein
MSKKRKRPSPVETTLLMALACGSSVETAAHKAGVSKRTVYRHLEKPDFCQQLKDHRFEMLHRATSMLGAASMESVKTLLSLTERTYPPAVRLGAAKAVLDLGLKLREATDLEERMSKIEESVRVRGDDSSR